MMETQVVNILVVDTLVVATLMVETTVGDCSGGTGEFWSNIDFGSGDSYKWKKYTVHFAYFNTKKK